MTGTLENLQRAVRDAETFGADRVTFDLVAIRLMVRDLERYRDAETEARRRGQAAYDEFMRRFR
jgi:hypothetical protein